jgi:tetratricopeptide (TPR) repeat protein
MTIDYNRFSKPIDNPQHISLLIPTRERTERLQKTLTSLEENTQDKSQIDVWIYVDRDDSITQDFLSQEILKLNYSFKINFSIEGKAKSLGEMVNSLWEKCTTNAGIYMPTPDDYLFATPGWDAIVREAFDRYPDRMLLAYPDDPTTEGKDQVTFIILSAEWINCLGRICPAYFPYWFEDAWLDNVAWMVQRKVKIDIRMEPQGGKGTTIGMRNLVFWYRFSENLLDDRIAESNLLRSAMYPKDSPEYKASVEAANLLVQEWRSEIDRRSPKYNLSLQQMEANLSHFNWQDFQKSPSYLIKESNYLALEANAVSQLSGKAFDLIQSRQFLEVLRLLETISYASKPLDSLYYWQAICRKELGQIAEAESALLKQLEVKPEHHSASQLLEEIRSVSQVANLPKSASRPVKLDLVYPCNLGHLGLSFVATLKRLGYLNRAFELHEGNYSQLFEYLPQSDSDFILLMHADHHMPFLHDTPEKHEFWNQIKVPKVCFCGEVILNSVWPNSLEKSASARQCFDYFMCIDERDIPFFLSKTDRVCFLPAFVDPDKFCVIRPLSERKNQLFFFGNTSNFGLGGIYEDRRQLLGQLLNARGVDFFPSPIGDYNSHQELVDLYNSYTVTIALPSNGQGWGYTNRMYEASACGTLIFQYRLKEQPIASQLFKEYQHYIPYEVDGFSQLMENLDYYLKHPQELEEIANSARAQVLSAHTVEKRIQQIIQFITTGEKIEHQLLPELARSSSETKNGLQQREIVKLNTSTPEGISEVASREVPTEISLYAVIKDNPNSSEAYKNLGLFLKDRGKINAAIRAIERAIKLQPDSAELYFYLGTIAQQQLRLNDAISYYQKAISFDSSLSQAYWNLGEILHDRGQLHEAEVYQQKALELQVNFSKT